MKAARAAGPSAPGSKQIPEGEPNCLAGLSFVFTGELSSLSRDEAVDLAKRYGGRVVGQPSSKTSFVVVGDNAGPSKLAAIDKHKLRKINEDEFLNLIATRSSDSADDKTKAKLAKEEQQMRKAAEEMEKLERKEAKERAKAIANAGGSPARTKLPADTSSQLWTVRYAPKTLKEICGNKGQIEKLHQWLLDWYVFIYVRYVGKLFNESQVLVFKGELQEARKEWHEHIQSSVDHRSTGHRQDD